jgi:hypothetical protein
MELKMNRISAQSRPQIALVKPAQDDLECYYSANPLPHPAKSAPQLSALDLMYAYYDAA